MNSTPIVSVVVPCLNRGEFLRPTIESILGQDYPSVATAVDFLRRHPDVGVVYGECGVIDARGEKVGLCYLHEWDLEYAVLNCDHCIPQPAAFLRRAVVEQVGWLNEAFYQKKDHELWLRIALMSEIVHLPSLLAHERNIRGLSFDAKTAAPACAQVTREFYAQPAIPASLRARRRRALSNSYLRGAEYAFSGGPLWGTILAYTIYAGVIDPTNMCHVAGRQLNFLKILIRKLRAYRPGAKPAASGPHA